MADAQASMQLRPMVLGFNLDDWLGYSTRKHTFVRDRHLGMIYWLLVLAILFWVVLVNVLWKNGHFEYSSVQGVPQIWYTHPVLVTSPLDPHKGFDFKSLDELPYCVGAKVDLTSTPRRCIYEDRWGIQVDSNQRENEVFIPTSKLTFSDELSCDLSSPGCSPHEAVYSKSLTDAEIYEGSGVLYYADVERFMLQFRSSFDRGSAQGSSLEVLGNVEQCREAPSPSRDHSYKGRVRGAFRGCDSRGGAERLSIECLEGFPCHLNDQAPRLDWDPNSLGTSSAGLSFLAPHRRARAESRSQLEGLNVNGLEASDVKASLEAISNGKDQIFATQEGDIFRLGKLLQLAGIDLDSDLNGDQLTLRQAGTAIEVTAIYNDVYPFWSSFGFGGVEYTYVVKELPEPYVEREYFAKVQPDNYPQKRRLISERGIRIVHTVRGRFGTFNLHFFLVMISTSAALFGVASGLTDFIAVYCHTNRRNYFKQKYQVTPIYEEMWECDICGYRNTQHVLVCQGLPKWETASDSPVCGAASDILHYSEVQE